MEAGHYINVFNITYEYIGLQLHFYLPRYITIYLLEVNINDRVLMFPYFIGLTSVNFLLRLPQKKQFSYKTSKEMIKYYTHKRRV